MKIELRGAVELAAHLEETVELELAKRVVRVNGAELNEKMVKEAVFMRYTPMAPLLYSTGATRRSIDLTFPEELTAKVKPHTNYATYVEYGTRKMRAQPFVRPAFEAQKDKFIEDMEKLVK